jgi:hypothetical protein
MQQKRRRQSAFDVIASPPPMQEWSPYRHVHPPHLDGYMRSVRGEFRLEVLAGGGTRLYGTTWYHLDVFPTAYWSFWSDAIVHAIHRRVLDHIKARSESAGDVVQVLDQERLPAQGTAATRPGLPAR